MWFCSAQSLQKASKFTTSYGQHPQIHHELWSEPSNPPRVVVRTLKFTTSYGQNYQIHLEPPDFPTIQLPHCFSRLPPIFNLPHIQNSINLSIFTITISKLQLNLIHHQLNSIHPLIYDRLVRSFIAFMP
jgi:hypothetical protein